MKCYIPPKPMTEEDEKKAEQDAIKENNKIFEHADYLLCLSLKNNAGFGYKRFLKYNSEAVVLGRHYIERYTTDDKDALEYAVDSYYALRRDLRDFGWDAETYLWKDDIFATFRPDTNSAAIRRKHHIRAEYAKNISFYTREMYCMAARWFCDEYGWREVRLNRVMLPAAHGYLALMRDYLRCSKAGDVAMIKRIKDIKKQYNDMGIFTEAL